MHHVPLKGQGRTDSITDHCTRSIEAHANIAETAMAGQRGVCVQLYDAPLETVAVSACLR